MKNPVARPQDIKSTVILRLDRGIQDFVWILDYPVTPDNDRLF